MQSYIKSPKQIAHRFGQMVKKARKDIGWTRNELAQRTDMSEQSIREIEGGTYSTDLYELLRLSFALKMPVHFMTPSLIGYREGSMEREQNDTADRQPPVRC